ncbi:MAG TPA: GNAT family N-acetyltransferase [Gammaproteobacteria bacterium]|nr:GNAT family N-acetyltransferase [Gammaproteobacteria bacterium]
MATARLEGATRARRRVHTRRLRPGDAAAIARLEDETYPEALRAGRRELEFDIEDADWEACNLGMGLFEGDALVGIFLLYYEADSRRLFDYFGLARPPDLRAEECLFVVDFVVRRPYSRYMWRLLADCMGLHRAYYGLPMLAFSPRVALDRWQARQKAFARFGYAYSGAQRFELEGPPHEIFLVRFEPSPEYVAPPSEAPDVLHVEIVRTRLAWRRLVADWDALLYQTPDWLAFQSFELQSIWWEHFAQDSRLFILVARDARLGVRAIAPLRIADTVYYGRPRRLVKFIGDHTEVDRPTVLRRGDDDAAVAAIFECLAAQRDNWDTLIFHEQPVNGLVPQLAAAHLHASRFVGVVAGSACPWVDVTGSWSDFLSSKPSSFRKALRRKLARLRERGEVSFSTHETYPEVENAFEDYLDVERRSWKPAERLGVAKNASSLAYHRALVQALGPRGQIIFRTLALDGKPIAATFGVLRKGQFLSLHIAHDEAYGAYSPGVLLTAYELEECYGRDDHSQYELLGGFLTNKTSWTTRTRDTVHVFAYRREPLFALLYVWHFRIEPVLKKVLKRLGLFPLAAAIKRGLRKHVLRLEEKPR